jgi:hypothetical protein
MTPISCSTLGVFAVCAVFSASAGALPVSFDSARDTRNFAEPDTADWRGYFPLSVGNTWQYHHITEDISFGVLDEWAEQWQVTSTTTIEEREYFVVSMRCERIFTHEGIGADPCRRAPRGRLVRYDDDGAAVVARTQRYGGLYEDEPYFYYPFRLDADFGSVSDTDPPQFEYWGGPDESFKVGDDNFAGRIKTVQIYSAVPGHLTFAHGIGLVKTYFSEMSGGGQTLRYAKTDQGEFGRPMVELENSDPFGVVYTEPADGSVSIGATADVRFVFNRPVKPETFSYFASEWARVTDTTFSEDSTSVVFSVDHDGEPQDVSWVIFGSVASDGELLPRAEVLRYTSADAWGDASVEGTIQMLVAVKRAENFGNFVFALFDRELGYEPGSWQLTGLERVVAASATEPREYGWVQTFELGRVRPGVYVPAAVVDYDRDGRIELRTSYWTLAGELQEIDSLRLTAGEHVVLETWMGVGGSAETAAPHLPLTLSPLIPNPAAESVAFSLTLDSPQSVRVEVVDMLGRRMATIVDERVLAARTHDFSWDSGSVPSGLYVIRASGPWGAATQPLVVVR